MLKTRMSQSGFSLIELAIGLVIVATLLSALLVPLATQLDQRRSSETQKLLDAAREALLGYVIGQERFPCPASAASNRQEAFVVGPPAGSAANGMCAQYRGFLPAVTLGLSPLDRSGYQTDGFGGDANRLRYAVADVDFDANAKVYTATSKMRALGMNLVSSANNRLWICTAASANDANCSAGVTLANGNAIAVVLSVGKNGFDTVRVPDADEAANLDMTNTNRVFVSRGQSDQAGNEFDDLAVWISPNIMISRLAAAGKL